MSSSNDGRVLFESGAEVKVPHAAITDSFGRPMSPPCREATHLIGRISQRQPVLEGDQTAQVLLAQDYGRADPRAWSHAVAVGSIEPIVRRNRPAPRQPSRVSKVTISAG